MVQRCWDLNVALNDLYNLHNDKTFTSYKYFTQLCQK